MQTAQKKSPSRDLMPEPRGGEVVAQPLEGRQGSRREPTRKPARIRLRSPRQAPEALCPRSGVAYRLALSVAKSFVLWRFTNEMTLPSASAREAFLARIGRSMSCIILDLG